MEDSNSIAWLCPAVSEDKGQEGKYTWEAMRLNMYIPEYIPPQEENCSRETTAPLEDDQDHTPNDTSYPRLHLAFNPRPKGDKGFVFGWDPECDIVLPKLQYISRRHCVLKFDDQRRLILRDTSSTGTIVSYNGQGEEMRRRFTWILGGHDVPRETKRIIIQIHEHIRFRITVSTHDEYPDLYNENVDLFQMGALALWSAGSTIAPTPRPQDPIRLEQEILGTGAFAVVQRVWDVSTGKEIAYKEPLNKKKFDEKDRKAWEKEADIMNRISHDHVVELLEDRSYPWPRLALEYVPCGSLEEQHKQANFSIEECLTILCQGLSVLVYLHGQKDPIVHRDIKPVNILVKNRYPLHIMFADFGLSKEGSSLTTICGSKIYLPPEIARYLWSPKGVPIEKYKSAVDIWSLSVVVLRYAYGLPYPGSGIGVSWCQEIVDMVKTRQSRLGEELEHLMDLLSTAMLVMDPKGRRSARYCYQEALRLPVPSQDRCLTPTPVSYAEGYAPTVVYNPAEEQGFGGQPNQPVSSNSCLIPDEGIAPESTRRSSQHEDSIRSSEIRRYVRSEAPPPESYRSRKRSTQSSTPSSTSGGRRTKRHGKATAASSSRRPRRAESEPVMDLFGQDWLRDPNCVGSSVAAMGEEEASYVSSWENWATEPSVEYVPPNIPEPVYEQNGYYDPHQGGGAVAQDAYVVDTGAQGGVEGASMNSDDYTAARLLYAIHEGERL